VSTGAWIVVAAVVLALAVGLWRAATDGRFRGTHVVRRSDPSPAEVAGVGGTGNPQVDASAEATPGAELVTAVGEELGERATLLQFSTEVCAPCKSTARVLDDLAARTADVAHVDLDVTHRPELASRYRVLQTPTTLILDADGAVRARIGGAVRRDIVVAELARVLAA
jgi:thiol-disulfide isomerase/thioredoxin